MSERGTWVSGAIAFVLLLLLTLTFAPEHIEDDLSERVAAELTRTGHTFATAEVSGRDVTLSGTAPDDVAAHEALDAVRTLWGVRIAREDFETVALRTSVPTVQMAPPASPREPAATPAARYSAREREALSRRISPELCQRVLDGLLASDSIHFDSDSAVIQRASRALLVHVATAAVHCPDARLIVGGHSDDTGDARANRRLSEQRAMAVAEALVARGVRAERIGIVGYGADRPVADNATATGRAMNRRIEITVEN